MIKDHKVYTAVADRKIFNVNRDDFVVFGAHEGTKIVDSYPRLMALKPARNRLPIMANLIRGVGNSLAILDRRGTEEFLKIAQGQPADVKKDEVLVKLPERYDYETVDFQVFIDWMQSGEKEKKKMKVV